MEGKGVYVAEPPPVKELVAEFPTALDEVMTLTPGRPERQPEQYLHWDKLQRLEHPRGFGAREWWLRTKLARLPDMRPLPLRGPDDVEFTFSVPDQMRKRLDRIDRRLVGQSSIGGVITSEREAHGRFLVNSRMEEAIRSSQLEGATTSRQVAREMLRSGREPKGRGERMIANNYRAMQFMREDLGDRLTPEGILELHRIVTEGTLDDPAAAGRIQRPGEPRVSVFNRDEDRRPLHVPPAAELLPERMQLLCEFANEGEDGERYVPPVVRAMLVHFWLAYDHPFADGNGRTARILFSWSMRTQGYWLAEYLSISRLLRTAPAQYARAFLETETDDGDTTYFLFHQLGVMEKAIEDLDEYLHRKTAEQRDVERMLDNVDDLNGRQIVLLTHAIKHPDHTYTFAGHAHSHRVTHETARADLGGLAERGLLSRRRRGRAYVFTPVPDLPARLRKSAA